MKAITYKTIWGASYIWESNSVENLTLNDVMGTNDPEKMTGIHVIRITRGEIWNQIRFYYGELNPPVKYKFWRHTLFILGEKQC